MKKNLLNVMWNDAKGGTFIFNDNNNDEIKLELFSGIYTFNKTTKQVTLFDGIKTKIINVKSWNVEAL